MVNVLYSKLMQDFLLKNKHKDEIINDVLEYKKIVKDTYKNTIEKENTDIKYVLEKYKKTSDSTKGLIEKLRNNIKTPLKKETSRDLNHLLLVYLNENFMKFCSNNMIRDCYRRLNKHIKGYIGVCDEAFIAAVTLKSINILNELYEKSGKEACNKFMDLLETDRNYVDGNIIYNTYYGILFKDQDYDERKEDYLKTDKIVNNLRKEGKIKYEDYSNQNVINFILNSKNLKLPDSIIKHICTDNQFNYYDINIVMLIMHRIFMCYEYIGYEDYSALINKILSNNLNNLNEEASFYDLSKLHDIYFDIYNNKNSKYDEDEVLGNLMCDSLDNNDLEDTYGNI